MKAEDLKVKSPKPKDGSKPLPSLALAEMLETRAQFGEFPGERQLVGDTLGIYEPKTRSFRLGGFQVSPGAP